MEDVDLGEPTSFLDHVYLACTQRVCQINKDIVANYRDMFESRISAGAKEKLQTRASGKLDAETLSSWSYDMEGQEGQETQTSDPGFPNCEVGVCVPPGVSLRSSEGTARIEVCLLNHVEEESPTWESDLESIELSLGMGDIQDCCHRCVLDDEFASYFGVDTGFASELSLSGS